LIVGTGKREIMITDWGCSQLNRVKGRGKNGFQRGWTPFKKEEKIGLG